MKNRTYRSLQALIASFTVLATAADILAYPSLGFKVTMGYLSVIIAFAGYLLYIASMFRDVSLSHQIRPHPLSWALFGLLTGIGWAVQVEEHAGAGSWCLGLTSLFCFVLAVVSYLKYDWEFSGSDWLWVGIGFGLFLLYRSTDMPLLSVSLATLADLVGYGPTIKKGWREPRSDNPVNFAFNSAKCVPALLALSSYSWETAVYLSMLLIMNGLVALMLVGRRVYLARR